MLRVVAHKSAAAARQYYAEGLRREDYYSEGQEVVGKWHGRAASLLGLCDTVTPDAFASLAENRHPVTGARLTARTKTERVVGYDLNFHAPKSLSVLYALTKDGDILNAFRSAVAETMSEIEALTATRVRKSGAQGNRVTGNLAWAEFVHFTARPVGGIPDPHLHVHCFAMNGTFDSEEGRWKAAKFRDIKKDAPYSEAVFHSRLTDKLVALGYGTERTRFGWEIKGIPRDVVERFSRRTAQIERLADARRITDAKSKDALGAASREGKRRGLTYSDLLAAWGTRLSVSERELITTKLRFGGVGVADRITAAAAVDYAADKLFAKSSVVEEKRLIAEALRYGVGHVKPEQIWREFGRRNMVSRKVQDEVLCTSLDVLAEEVALIGFVRSGRGMCAPFHGRSFKVKDARLSDEQQAAVRHILGSRDQVIALKGGAGVGKTTLMRESVAAIESKGLRVFAFAPSAAASRETLREAGFQDAETVAHLLSNRKLQEKTRGQVIWVDEAGLLGVRDMWQIMRIAGNSTRVILTGDTSQHAPVARGDAFRLLQKFAGLKVAEVTQIRRQEKADYRKAVAALSKGDLRTAFRRLDELGAILEVGDDAERYRMLAADFLDLSSSRSVPLVVSPTHAESEKVTAAIREAKRAAGGLKGERSFLRLHNLQWEEADRMRAENYSEGMVVQFHQNAPGIKRGEMFRVAGRDEAGAVQLVGNRGRKVALPLKDAARFLVFEEREIRLAKGDRIRVTRNGETADGRRISNGNLFTIEKFGRKGEIILTTGGVLDSHHGHLTYGYCQTSHSVQSKSVRDVLVAQSSASFGVSSQEQFYVTVSRGKETIRIYTDNRAELQRAVGNTSIRKAGVELAGFSAQDVAAFMSDEMNAEQWRQHLQNRRAEGQPKSYVEDLIKQRRKDLHGKQQNEKLWEKYIAMRRALNGASGKHRSKGYPAEPSKSQPAHARGLSLPRQTQRSSAKPAEHVPWNIETQKKMAGEPTGTGEKKVAGRSDLEAMVPRNEETQRKMAAAAAKKEPQPAARTSRAARAFDAAKENFKKVTTRSKGEPAKQPERQLPRNNKQQVSKHRVKQKAAESEQMAKKKVKMQTQTQKPPAPRRGR